LQGKLSPNTGTTVRGVPKLKRMIIDFPNSAAVPIRHAPQSLGHLK
jgi:hypothetical protein